MGIRANDRPATGLELTKLVVGIAAFFTAAAWVIYIKAVYL